MNNWAKINPNTNVVAQTYDNYHYNYFRDTYFTLKPEAYECILAKSDVLIGHAGTGTIISALEYSKPLIIMPRKADLHEHRNEHQKWTAEKFKNTKGIYVAEDETELFGYLNRLVELDNGSFIESDSKVALLNFLKSEIFN
jgi:UDP-N-acetylglucosamine transferase subunit ALG13